MCQGFLGSANGTLQASKTVLPILISFPGFCDLAAVRSVRLCVRQHAEPGGIQSWYTCSANQLSLDSDILGSDRRSSVGAVHRIRERVSGLGLGRDEGKSLVGGRRRDCEGDLGDVVISNSFNFLSSQS